jgi:hypothetical protein
VLAATATLALAACEAENELDPNLVTVSSIPDAFQFSVSGLDNVTDGERYFWAVTGSEVAVDITQSISGGTAILQLRDGTGDVVYQEDVADQVDDTLTGVLGLWQVDIVLTKVTGGFDVAAQRVDTTTTP